MLGNPNLVLTNGTSPLTFNPTKTVGKYVWDGATMDSPVNFIAKANNTASKARFSVEFIQATNDLTQPNIAPDKKLRVSILIECDPHVVFTSAFIEDRVKYTANGLTAARITQLMRDEV